MTQYVDLSQVQPFLDRGDLVLTHSLRLAREIRIARLAAKREQGHSVVEGRSSAALPIEAWFESRWREQVERGVLPVCRVLTRYEERLLWRQVIDESLERSGDFRLLRPSVAAERASQSRRAVMLYSAIGSRYFDNAQFQFDFDGKIFIEWVRGFEKLLLAKQAITREEAYHQLLTLERPEPQPLVLFHMPPMPPLFARLLDHLGTVQAIPPSESPESSLTTDNLKIAGRKFSEPDAELAAVSRWAYTQFAEKERRCAIVLLDTASQRQRLEYFLRREFDCLGERYDRLPVNFSSGVSLFATPMYRDALLGLRAGLFPLTRQECLTLLNSPFLLPAGFAETSAGLRLASALFDLGKQHIAPGDFRHCVSVHAKESVLASVIGAVREQSRQLAVRQSGQYWVEVIRGRLALWQWPARHNIDSMEYQQIQRLEPSLDMLAQALSLVGLVTYPEAVQQWQSVLAETVFQPQTARDSIQVLDAREAIGLSFDQVWVCGLHAEGLPQPARLLPFIPPSLQKELGLAEASEKLRRDHARLMLRSWRQTNGVLIASYSSGVGEEGVYPSEFLDLQPGDVLAMPSAIAKPDVVLEWIEDKASALTSSETITGGSQLLKNQALCPFKAWTDHRLKLKEPAEEVVGLSATERGALVHQALYYLWGLIEDSEALAKAPPKRREAWIKEAVSGGLRALEADAEQRGVSVRARAGAACLDLEQARLATLMVEWLDTEAQRSVPFEVVNREVKASIELAGLTLNLRLDRVDALSDGRKLVIDYKTGVVQRKALLAERLKEPQLPLYTLLDENIQGVAYGRVVAGGDSDFTWLGEGLGLKKSSRGADDLASQTRDLVEPVSDWPALRQLWYERLEGLAEEFMAGHVAVTPSPDACRYCAYAGLCRFDDQYGVFSEESEG